MSKRTYVMPDSDNAAGSSRGDRQRQKVPDGRLVDGVFVLNDAEEGGEPSQPEVISPYGDRAQCEYVHRVTIQRWDPDTESYEPEQTTFRCTTFVGDADFEFGWRFCTRCRPPFVAVARRARSIMHMVMARIQHLGLVLDPPMDPEATRLRHLGIIARRMPPWCQCACDRCLYRIRSDHDTPAARRQRHIEDLVAVYRTISIPSSCLKRLEWRCGRSLLCGYQQATWMNMLTPC